ncbi:hypothetical protein PR048_003442 [Dryococelus australis]|uniref:Uncharacterized protein n=1 Tax=Dryococelus australis TaxID=614101 RepID=A0ABQ9IN53_9NEOP|nr:hypothetical protein PR048_003442 [Dryococelus australis]
MERSRSSGRKLWHFEMSRDFDCNQATHNTAYRNVFTSSSNGKSTVAVKVLHSPGTALPAVKRIQWDSWRAKSLVDEMDLLGDLPFAPPLHSGAAPFSPHFTLICSQDLVKSRLLLTERVQHLLKMVSSVFDAYTAAPQQVAEYIIEDGRRVLDGFECCTKAGLKLFSVMHRSDRLPGATFAYGAQRRRSDNGDATTFNNCAITSTREALNWRVWYFRRAACTDGTSSGGPIILWIERVQNKFSTGSYRLFTIKEIRHVPASCVANTSIATLEPIACQWRCKFSQTACLPACRLLAHLLRYLCRYRNLPAFPIKTTRVSNISGLSEVLSLMAVVVKGRASELFTTNEIYYGSKSSRVCLMQLVKHHRLLWMRCLSNSNIIDYIDCRTRDDIDYYTVATLTVTLSSSGDMATELVRSSVAPTSTVQQHASSDIVKSPPKSNISHIDMEINVKPCLPIWYDYTAQLRSASKKKLSAVLQCKSAVDEARTNLKARTTRHMLLNLILYKLQDKAWRTSRSHGERSTHLNCILIGYVQKLVWDLAMFPVERVRSSPNLLSWARGVALENITNFETVVLAEIALNSTKIMGCGCVGETAVCSAGGGGYPDMPPPPGSAPDLSTPFSYVMWYGETLPQGACARRAGQAVGPQPAAGLRARGLGNTASGKAATHARHLLTSRHIQDADAPASRPTVKEYTETKYEALRTGLVSGCFLLRQIHYWPGCRQALRHFAGKLHNFSGVCGVSSRFTKRLFHLCILTYSGALTKLLQLVTTSRRKRGHKETEQFAQGRGIGEGIRTNRPRLRPSQHSPVAYDFRTCESCWTMSLFGGFSLGFPVPPPPPLHSRAAPYCIPLQSPPLQYVAAPSRSHFIHMGTCTGSPYLHMVVWAKDHPNFETQEGIQMIDRVCVCEIQFEDSDLRDRELKCQIHRHTHTCKMNNEYSACRFNFPLKECAETHLIPSDTDDERLVCGRGPSEFDCEAVGGSRTRPVRNISLQVDRLERLELHRVLESRCARNEVRMEQHWNARAGKTGDTRENPPTSGVVLHNSQLRKSGINSTGDYRTPCRMKAL